MIQGRMVFAQASPGDDQVPLGSTKPNSPEAGGSPSIQGRFPCDQGPIRCGRDDQGPPSDERCLAFPEVVSIPLYKAEKGGSWAA